MCGYMVHPKGRQVPCSRRGRGQQLNSQKTPADVFLGSWLQVAVTEKEVNGIVLGTWPSSL